MNLTVQLKSELVLHCSLIFHALPNNTVNNTAIPLFNPSLTFPFRPYFNPPAKLLSTIKTDKPVSNLPHRFSNRITKISTKMRAFDSSHSLLPHFH